nr:zf-CCHC domain-containing protein/DUF4219 domain-containing protein/UBN2 domain-containing protein [Tanacetum cinerariifolium]
MATLPSNIIFEILSRMPVKSLVRFRCVSKFWCEYIDSPYFATIQSKQAIEEEPALVMLQATRDWCNPNQPRIVSFHNTVVSKHDNATCLLEVKKNSFLEFKCCKKSSEYPLHVVLGSCNGLFYLSQDQCDKFNSLVVINPLRKECFELPPMDKKPYWRLSYEESCGLGFDYSTKTFKMATPTTTRTNSFDVRKEKFRVIKCPPRKTQHHSVLFDKLVDLHGEVGYVYDNVNNCMEVWVLKRKEWVMHCRIDKKPLPIGIEVWGRWNKDGDLSMGTSHRKEPLFLYKVKNGVCEKANIVGREEDFDFQVYIFETYVKAKDLDLWNIILNGDFPPVTKNKVTQILKIVPFEEQSDDLKKKLANNNEAKMVLYNALPKKEHERIFMCKTVKDIWQSLLITHQDNSQVKDNKIDLIIKQYEQFTILDEESIDSGFARFNTIITSLKPLDEGFSSKNYVRKFLRALHPKWRAKVTVIKESKDLSSLALEKLIGNLKVHEVVMEKDFEIYRGKKERVKSIALKAKKESSDDETSTSGSDDKEYAMAARNFKKFFRRKGKFVRQQREEKKSFRQRDEKKGKSDRKCFKCGDLNHLIGDRPKPPRNKDQNALIGGYSQNSIAYIVLNKHTMKVEESLNVTFDERTPTKLSSLVDDDVSEEEAIKNYIKVVNNNNEEDESIEVDEVVNIKESKNHQLDQVIGNLNQKT